MPRFQARRASRMLKGKKLSESAATASRSGSLGRYRPRAGGSMALTAPGSWMGMGRNGRAPLPRATAAAASPAAMASGWVAPASISDS